MPALGFRLLDPNDSVRRSCGRRIGVLGGSFNPPHAGHVHLSETALTRLDLDEVWWLLTPQNPLKASTPPPLRDRLAACQGLIEDRRIKVTALEDHLGSNRTLDSLRAMRRLFPDRQFIWLMGADNLASFHRWHGWRGIAELVPLAVIDRPSYGLAALSSPTTQKLKSQRRFGRRYNSGWRFIAGPKNPQSSTALRRAGQRLATVASDR